MINDALEKAINDQVNAELYSAYLYLSMSSWFSSLNLNGFASWMRVQAQEETMHALKFYDYLMERGGTVTLAAIEAPPAAWDSPLAAFSHVYEHEQKVTGLINALMDLAIKKNDHATTAFLQWYVTEQVEEESSADEVVQKLKLVKDQGSGLLMLDQQLGQRAFTQPAEKE